MKKFFRRASKSFNLTPKGGPPAATPPNATAPLVPGLQPKFMVPPVPHPCPWDHISILATDDALLLKPHFPELNTSSPLTLVRIPFGKTAQVQEYSVEKGDTNDWSESIVVYGIVGILELFTASYLLVISSRSEVGQHLDPSHVVYCVKAVTPIPLTAEKAKIAINTLASRNIGLTRPSIIPSLSPSDSPAIDESPALDGDSVSPSPKVQFSAENDVRIVTPNVKAFPANVDGSNEAATSSRTSSMSDLSVLSSDSDSTSPIAKVIAERLSFWTRLSKRTPTSDSAPEPPAEPKIDRIIQEEEPSEALYDILESTAPEPTSSEERHSELEEKIVKEVIREFVKGGMYFAYTFDITRSLQHKKDLVAKSERHHGILAELNALPSPEHAQEFQQPAPGTHSMLIEPNPTLPLWRRVDRRFWWNEWLSKSFVDAGLHSYVLPIMQGYYQIAQFSIPPDPLVSEVETPVDYIIVSRRSRNRAGLRYQRRGIDDESHVANFVETETVVHVKRENLNNIFSYVQIRGSIPLFWTQTGYGLKPPPVLSTNRTHEQNMEAMGKHFARTVSRYGPHKCVNLAEQQGKEAVLTEAYRTGAAELGDSDVSYHEYDFHNETKGMKYENIAQLITALERTFEQHGFFWMANDNIMTEQKGVFRTNCIDCLDRTNVVQSAFARFVLNKQLSVVGLVNTSGEKRVLIELVFNDVWANNGDAISRAYAGTSALKGDFTRTGKRDLAGLLNDGVNSLARMYTSTFSDWFSQAVIDFMLGCRSLTVFSEFLLKLQSSDPRELVRLSKIRAEAIADSVSRVLPEGERLLSGWTLFAPEELDTRIADKFEEKVLLLTAAALYIIRYDYTLEKVKSYTRIPLGDITSIRKGAYILSPLEEASRDPLQNAGLMISWLTTHQMTRVTSYSIRNCLDGVADQASIIPSITRSSTISMVSSLTKSRLSTLGRRGATLSEVLAQSNPEPNSGTSFAAFKILPLDPSRLRRASSDGGGYIEHADALSVASNCLEAANIIVDCIQRACEDLGNNNPNFLVTEDIVSLAEAERSTTIFAKMEYGVKRLLWLGAT